MNDLKSRTGADGRHRGRFDMGTAAEAVVLLEGLRLCGMTRLCRRTYRRTLKVWEQLIVRLADAGDRQVGGGPQEQQERDIFP